MPAWEEEIQAAEDEGVQITYLSAPQEILVQDGKVVGLRCIRMELSEPDSSGRKRPIPVPGSEYEIEIDQLIPAIGQRPDLSALEDITGLTYTRWGTTEVDAITYATEQEGVFAGGDLQTGPWVVIGAIGAGKEAAESIFRYIEKHDMAAGREPVVNENPVYRPIPEDEPIVERARMPELAVDKRKGNFDEVELGYAEAQGRAEAARCLNCGYCCECYQCVDACLANAIDHSQQVQDKEIEVGSVILTTGSEPYDPAHLENVYHYKTSPNVLTSLEFERILSASGPTMGHLQRPSDGKDPKKVAWLQCVGSRDTNQCGNSYCSSVCCMYAIKDSMIAKEHAAEDLDCVVFNMDIRTFGKDYEKYYNRAKDAGIRFIKSRIHSIDEIADTGNLSIRYMDDAGELQVEEFDMVVLSVGLQVPESTVQLAERLGIELNDSRFAVSHPFAPVETTRPGVYACGVFQEPKDIPSSVTEASAAACTAGASLGAARNSLTRSVEIPQQIDVSDQDARVGVFVCNCGVNISSVVDVKGVTEYAKTLPNVVYAQENLFTCSQDSQDEMKELIKEHKLNRVVVAACSPKTHEPIFQDTMESCGLNKYLFEMANIRNQDSWVHSETAETASGKAKDLVRMSVARAETLHPLQEKKIPVVPKGLVIGGGVAGMNAALGLADQGYEVVLIEKEAELGGLAKQLTATIEGANIGEYLKDLVSRVISNERIQVLTNALVVGFGGFKGNFTTEILVGPDMVQRKIEHGVVILATGAHEHRPQEYLYGDDPRVMTQLELAERMQKGELEEPRQVVMIQCIGSRNDENPNCSRVCCQTAVKNALHIKEEYPDAQVFVLYRDIRTYGLLEDYYTEARRQGVFFFRFDPEDRSAGAQCRYGSRRYRGAVIHCETGPHAGRLFHGGSREIAAGRYGHRRNFCVRHRAQPQTDFREHCPGLCGRFAGGDLLVPDPVDAFSGYGSG
jgi:heterodisulfide reductase subunit A-like polyferredoxin